jgi:uncharacterized protein YcfJ
MASSIEDILLAKAMADAESQVDPAVAMGGGAALGASLGVLAGQPLHMMGNSINGVKNKIQASRGLPPVGRNPLRAGPRMAGGLVGAILGGALGAGARQMMVQDSPAATILARMQAQGTLNPMDRQQLESVLKDIYNNPGM